MRISIAKRSTPYCHLPGTSVVLPGCGYQVQIFPCLVRIYDLKQSFPKLLVEFTLELKGPIKQFTFCTNLERGCISIWGETLNGFIRYHLMGDKERRGVRLFIEKAPQGNLSIHFKDKTVLLKNHEMFDFLNSDEAFEPYLIPPCDRLCLGNHKASDWELVRRRLDLAEILPFWHRLGQLVPISHADLSQEGTLSLLHECHSVFDKRPEQAERVWLNLFLCGFNGILVPQLEDTHYQGLISLESLQSKNLLPLVLLSEGSRLIRRLFVQQNNEEVHILPYLIPSLSCGRLIDVPLKNGGFLSFEWTKKTIRRGILYLTEDQELVLKFPANVRSYRIRPNLNSKGERKESSSLLSLQKNCYYFFDNFK